MTVASSGPEALRILDESDELHLVILDLMLPGLSGPDVLRYLRSHARWHELPVIVLTAAAQDNEYRTAAALGASEFMTKPFSPRRLLARALALVGEPITESTDSTTVL